MNPSLLLGPISVGIAAGACSALLFVAGAGGSLLLALLLFLLAPLPTFLAGLGWGPRAVLAAGAAGMVVSAAIQGAQLAIIHVTALAAPVALQCWLVHLRRLVPQPDGQAAALEWYSAGRLVMWIACMAGVVTAISLLVIGSDIETITRTARDLLDRQMKTWIAAGGTEPRGIELDTLTTVFVRILPVATAMSWMFMMLLNLWLAGRILRASGRLSRPWPRLSALALPIWLAPALATLIALSVGANFFALVASGFAGALLTAHAVVGLAVLHWISYGKANRGFTLLAAYVSALALAPYGTLPVALVGVLEPWLRLRSRVPGPPPLPPPASAGSGQPP